MGALVLVLPRLAVLAAPALALGLSLVALLVLLPRLRRLTRLQPARAAGDQLLTRWLNSLSMAHTSCVHTWEPGTHQGILGEASQAA